MIIQNCKQAVALHNKYITLYINNKELDILLSKLMLNTSLIEYKYREIVEVGI